MAIAAPSFPLSAKAECVQLNIIPVDDDAALLTLRVGIYGLIFTTPF